MTANTLIHMSTAMEYKIIRRPLACSRFRMSMRSLRSSLSEATPNFSQSQSPSADGNCPVSARTVICSRWFIRNFLPMSIAARHGMLRGSPSASALLIDRTSGQLSRVFP